jgi:hypothetical protein
MYIPLPNTKTKDIRDFIRIKDYVRNFRTNLSKQAGLRIKVNTTDDIQKFNALINDPANTAYKSIRDFKTGEPFWNRQNVVYVPSNLGRNKGYVFYFLCSGCHRRTKYLYFYSGLEPPLCRQCCYLPYKQTSYQERKKRKKMAEIIYRNPMPFPPKPYGQEGTELVA